MNYIFCALMLLSFCGCTGETSSASDPTDSTALDAIDSSIIMNDSTQLPRDSLKTTVAH